MELSLLLPVFAIVFAGVVDVGSALHAKSRLSTSVSGASSYALANAAKVTPAGAADLADLLTKVTSAAGTKGVVDINNAIVATRMASPNGGQMTATTGNTPSNADACWCPSVNGGSVVWGSPVACGGSCSGAVTAGKFVWIKLESEFKPMFSTYGLVGTNISSIAMVRVR